MVCERSSQCDPSIGWLHALRSGCLPRESGTKEGWSGTAVKRRPGELQTEAQANRFLDGSRRDERERNAANRPRPKGDRAGQWAYRVMERTLVTALSEVLFLL